MRLAYTLYYYSVPKPKGYRTIDTKRSWSYYQCIYHLPYKAQIIANNESLLSSSAVSLLNQYMTWEGALRQQSLILGLVMEIVGSESKMSIVTHRTCPFLELED